MVLPFVRLFVGSIVRLPSCDTFRRFDCETSQFVTSFVRLPGSCHFELGSLTSELGSLANELGSLTSELESLANELGSLTSEL